MSGNKLAAKANGPYSRQDSPKQLLSMHRPTNTQYCGTAAPRLQRVGMLILQARWLKSQQPTNRLQGGRPKLRIRDCRKEQMTAPRKCPSHRNARQTVSIGKRFAKPDRKSF